MLTSEWSPQFRGPCMVRKGTTKSFGTSSWAVRAAVVFTATGWQKHQHEAEFSELYAVQFGVSFKLNTNTNKIDLFLMMCLVNFKYLGVRWVHFPYWIYLEGGHDPRTPCSCKPSHCEYVCNSFLHHFPWYADGVTRDFYIYCYLIYFLLQKYN